MVQHSAHHGVQTNNPSERLLFFGGEAQNAVCHVHRMNRTIDPVEMFPPLSCLGAPPPAPDVWGLCAQFSGHSPVHRSRRLCGNVELQHGEAAGAVAGVDRPKIEEFSDQH